MTSRLEFIRFLDEKAGDAHRLWRSLEREKESLIKNGRFSDRTLRRAGIYRDQEQSNERE